MPSNQIHSPEKQQAKVLSSHDTLPENLVFLPNTAPSSQLATPQDSMLPQNTASFQGKALSPQEDSAAALLGDLSNVVSPHEAGGGPMVSSFPDLASAYVASHRDDFGHSFWYFEFVSVKSVIAEISGR